MGVPVILTARTTSKTSLYLQFLLLLFQLALATWTDRKAPLYLFTKAEAVHFARQGADITYIFLFNVPGRQQSA